MRPDQIEALEFMLDDYGVEGVLEALADALGRKASWVRCAQATERGPMVERYMLQAEALRAQASALAAGRALTYATQAPLAIDGGGKMTPPPTEAASGLTQQAGVQLQKDWPIAADVHPLDAPKIASIHVTKHLAIRVMWSAGIRVDRTDVVDLSPMINVLQHYRPLRNDDALFRTVHLIENGRIVAWGDDDQIDMAADSIEELTMEQCNDD